MEIQMRVVGEKTPIKQKTVGEKTPIKQKTETSQKTIKQQKKHKTENPQKNHKTEKPQKNHKTENPQKNHKKENPQKENNMSSKEKKSFYRGKGRQNRKENIFTILLTNLRGFKSKETSLKKIIRKQRPSVIVMNETLLTHIHKLVKKQNREGGRRNCNFCG